MFNVVKKEINWNGKLLSLETGKIARQASSVVARYGKTTVLCAVTVANKVADDADFFPLTVNYLERFYAAGKIPGGFFKREGKPSDASTLISRLIDRPIRPIFPNNFYNEVNIVCTVLSYDPECTPDIVALIGSSAALAISKAPIQTTIAACRVGFINNEFVANPSNEQLKNSTLDLVVAGTPDSVLMVESEAKELSQEQMLQAIEFGQQQYTPIIDLIKQLASETAEPKLQVQATQNDQLKQEITNFINVRLVSAYKKLEKQARSQDLEQIEADIKAKFLNIEQGIDEKLLKSIFKQLSQDIVRIDILKNNIRIDGRKPDEIRQINIETGILPQVHGSALFTRGETQALVVTTLGADVKDKQLVESLDSTLSEESFMLHYNFPPYSVGEVGPLKSPGRREIGHGKLAWRSINPVYPSEKEFSYTTRVVSEITESNGSSSMATVCGTSLSLMDAGVPIKSAVSGIAMGLIKQNNDYVILSDIMGDEDHLGDMDFKVAGTTNGITALQMDIKITGINIEIMQKALSQACEGKKHILQKMNDVITTHRTQFNNNVPRVETMTISKDKIREVIGARGAVIKDICAKSGAVVDIEDSGLIKISSSNADCIKKAIDMIKDITFEPQIGNLFEGPVVKVIDAGAFITISDTRDGFVHISELADHRIDFVEDVINEGDIVKVKVIGFDKKGRPKLSYRCVDQATGEDISDKILNKPQIIDEREFAKSKPRSNDSRDRRDRSDRGSRDREFDSRDRGDRDRNDRDRGDREGRRNRDDNNGNKDGDKNKKRRFPFGGGFFS
jgi:polyribonucleotide nucleotidyltransferase